MNILLPLYKCPSSKWIFLYIKYILFSTYAQPCVFMSGAPPLIGWNLKITPLRKCHSLVVGFSEFKKKKKGKDHWWGELGWSMAPIVGPTWWVVWIVKWPSRNLEWSLLHITVPLFLRCGNYCGLYCAVGANKVWYLSFPSDSPRRCKLVMLGSLLMIMTLWRINPIYLFWAWDSKAHQILMVL